MTDPGPTAMNDLIAWVEVNLPIRGKWIHRGVVPHYDLTPSNWRRAQEKGAILMSRRKEVKVIRAWRDRRNTSKSQ